MAQQPSIGRIVHVPMDPATNNGADVAPAVITRVWSETCVNVRVLSDGHAIEWRTSVMFLEDLAERASGYHFWTWPPRVGA
ncbi:hypothetical protein ACIOWI_29835 [Streptomyces sp. NPDC087659]|uniref:hypothetical protein n=1 Tax=Streptomyces sp. NPDC087659 TaxID=3365801 RepID=UPI00382C2461